MRSDNGQGRRFVYKKRDPKLIEDRASQTTSSFAQITKERFPLFKARAGTNKLRILPPTWEDADHYAYNVLIHYNVGPDSGRYLCPKMIGKPCAICEERVHLVRQGESDAAKLMRPQDSRIAWVIDRDKESEGPQLWLFGKTADIEFAVLSRDEDTGDTLYIDDPEEGYDIRFRCDNPGPHAKYTARTVSRRSSPLADGRKQDEWLDYIQKYPIPDTLNFYSYRDLQEAVGGDYYKKEQEEEEPQEPIRRRSLRDEEDERDTPPPAEESDYDENTGELPDGERGAPFDTEDDRQPQRGRLHDNREEAELTREESRARRESRTIQHDPTERPRLRPRDEPEHTREVNPSRETRENLRQLRPPGQRPSTRER